MASEQTAQPDISNYTTSPTTSSNKQSSPSATTPRAIVESTTNSWKPSFERRQSWNQEDQKRALQMSHIEDVKTGPGFTERS
ncbi:hypothetical protein HER10_EVM0003206 [Colletotrichum scovillei]|uniref:Protein PLM2 n=1 Tax=Colletotrichum scovillei TaxID=1209932 RepID=A0A9P7QQ34_9PEZI|nr:uncharacterized protein HER10_EVM0003206 [Colletotrichum scovillei]KAF4778333.1 hypothetical protein HER10_EVM0003206 [Colletotrichum scovillei]KAG7038520.1 Protein PLM2 [Colletotrichum scovillei]KAG7040699.1 Protein PLM2 [Colletotrichum scovillei]KAG7060743.1 Protein PLM2 [Colletotrichum scovillei]